MANYMVINVLTSTIVVPDNVINDKLTVINGDKDP